MKSICICLIITGLSLASTVTGTVEPAGINIEPVQITSEIEKMEYGESLYESENTETPMVIWESFSDEPPNSGYVYSSPVERAYTAREDELIEAEWPENDWYNDIEIYPGRAGTGQDFDVDEDTGYLYAVVDTDHDGTSTTDSLLVYRSQDNGVTWSYYDCGTSTYGTISNPKVRVLKDGSGDTWVMMMGIWETSGAGILWTRRFPVAGGTPVWEQAAGDASCADLDADVGSGAWAYIVYTEAGTQSIRATRNGIGGGGWVSDSNIYAGSGITDNLAAIAAGADGTVSIGMIIDTPTDVPSIRIKRSTNYGSTWLGSGEVAPPGSWDDLEDIDIAYTHSAVPQTAWITATFIFPTSDNFGYFLSTDTGVNWAWQSVFSSGNDENHGSIRVRKSDGSPTVAYNLDPGDDVMFTWTIASNPTNFSTPIAINEFPVTGYWPATAGWNQSNNSAIIYADYTHNYRIMYDSYNNTGIDGTSNGLSGLIQNSPNPFSATTNISFTLTQNSPVTITVYNIAGQLVSTVVDNQSFTEGVHSVQWDGQSLSPGVYFCRVSADGISQTHRMLMVK